MPVLSLAPAVSLLTAFQRVSPVRPLRTWWRTTEDRFNPPRIAAHVPQVRTAQDALVARGEAGLHQIATIQREAGRGRTPTIVLGGFVPDAPEQVFLLRRFFLRFGDLHYVCYPRQGFSLDMMCAQLDDLVEELTRAGRPPVIFSVSFGSGILLEWLRRARVAGRRPAIAGTVLVSPVGCVEDILDPRLPKPATLLGRALKPYLAEGVLREEAVEKSRTIFTRMFEAGAQNKASLRMLMTRAELHRLYEGVMGTIRGVSAEGARERVRALRQMPAPAGHAAPGSRALSSAPCLVLYAEKEDAVLDASSPTRRSFESAMPACFPAGRVQVVSTPLANPVQHASLIFHAFDFLPPINAFYQRLRAGRLPAAA